MIKIIHDLTEYTGWIDPLCRDAIFSTPFYNLARVLSVYRKECHIVLGTFDGNTLTGIFCLLVLDEEQYMETAFLYTREQKAYEDLTDYLAGQYPGYEIWFVFNPANYVLRAFLLEKQAFFYTEQRYMEYKGALKQDVHDVIPYCESYRDAYIRVHSKDGYWDGEKVLADLQNFNVFLYVSDGQLAGYIDLSRDKDPNEIMDLLVLPEYRNQGIGTLLLQKAIFAGGSHRLILTVDIDNEAAIHLYKKTGFEERYSNNSITAKLFLRSDNACAENESAEPSP